jgi:hypothetical protein
MATGNCGPPFAAGAGLRRQTYHEFERGHNFASFNDIRKKAGNPGPNIPSRGKELDWPAFFASWRGGIAPRRMA